MPELKPGHPVMPGRLVHWRVSQLAMVFFACTFSSLSFAYGAAGHLIAGSVAEDRLCERAKDEFSALAGEEDLGEIGLWADRIRGDDSYADAAPWHYMNIADGERLADFEHPPEGDVLWAVQHFSDRLRDESLHRSERAEALKFLVHFVVDLHQPLHVGLAEDRGGNSITIDFQGRTTNLHRFWDTHAVESAGLSIVDYAKSIRRAAIAADESVSLDPLVWAEESLRLRSRVYDYGQQGREPPPVYLEFAETTTRDRLSQAARRLAGTLNSIFCD